MAIDHYSGTQVFTPIQNSFTSEQQGQQAVFLIGAAFCFVGAAASWFLIPNRAKDLESEDQRFRRYLIESGYRSEFGESFESQIAKSGFKLGNSP